MYVFPEFNDIYKPGKLKKFVADLHSGKLHREFHYGPDSNNSEHEESKPNSDSDAPAAAPASASSPKTESDGNQVQEVHDNEIHDNENHDNDIHEEESPPDSTFIKLAPSEKRYTLLRNEL